MLGELAWRGFSFAYGVVNLVSMVAIATLRDGALTNGSSAEEKREFAAAQKRYWSIEREPLPGFTHRFFTLRNGLRLHYVVNKSAEASTPKNVAIFIHGFPDSFLLWKNLLTADTLRSHILIAVDIPGYGGSDGLPKYGPNEILEAITEFVLGMRTQYLKEEAKLVVVSHDWGSVIAARLASEANQLADRFVIASAVIPQHAYSNALVKAKSAKQMLHTLIRNPLRISLLKNALSTLKPVLSQIGRSFYVCTCARWSKSKCLIEPPPLVKPTPNGVTRYFCFNLPYPLYTFFAYFGNYWLLRTLHNVAAGLLKPDGTWARKLNDKEAADFMAMSSGPGITQIQESNGQYPDAVKKRTRDHGLAEKIRIYREHLILDPWEKSLETVVALSEIPPSSSRSSSGAGLFDDGPPGALKAPATIVYGQQDPAFNRQLGLEGIGDYLTKGSQVLLLEGAGHWLPFEGLGSKVLEDVAEWALSDEQQPLKESFDGLPDAKFVVEK